MVIHLKIKINLKRNKREIKITNQLSERAISTLLFLSYLDRVNMLGNKSSESSEDE